MLQLDTHWGNVLVCGRWTPPPRRLDMTNYEIRIQNIQYRLETEDLSEKEYSALELELEDLTEVQMERRSEAQHEEYFEGRF